MCVSGHCEPACGPGACAGCCQAGQCLPGMDAATCGTGGSACSACGAGQVCASGVCTPCAQPNVICGSCGHAPMEHIFFLTNAAHDPDSQPEYKVCAVRIEKPPVGGWWERPVSESRPRLLSR